METKQEIDNHLNQIKNLVESLSNKNHRTSERINTLIKVLAKTKTDLERSLKNPNQMIETIFNCIDACREVTPYYSADAQKTKIDPPLTQEEKDQFVQKFEEYKAKK